MFILVGLCCLTSYCTPLIIDTINILVARKSILLTQLSFSFTTRLLSSLVLRRIVSEWPQKSDKTRRGKLVNYPPIGKWIIHVKCGIVSSDDDTCERVQWKSDQILFEAKFTLHISEQNKICFLEHSQNKHKDIWLYFVIKRSCSNFEFVKINL